MKNFKQVAFGLLVGAMAIGFSAFTNATNVNKHHRVAKAGMITNDFIVQPTLDNFRQDAGPSSTNCKLTSDRECIYDVTTSGQSNIPDQTSYTKAEVDSYLSSGWLSADPNSHSAQYRP